MPIEGFDYKEFAQMMSSQAGELVPKNFNDMQRNYVVKTLTNFTLLAGEAISNDTKLNFNADQAVFVTQIIAEWSFHKSIDLVHSGIMPEHWDGVMQKIAFTIFEIAKQAIQKNIPQDKTLQLIEHHVDKTYRDAIADLEKRGVISSEISITRHFRPFTIATSISSAFSIFAVIVVLPVFTLIFLFSFITFLARIGTFSWFAPS